ncbi:MAG TPA: hypothetical protein VFV89_05490 [Nocardioides sp.]|nr:hypothetical protein [Nocardioides sp.]HEX5087241.1 hypothetical protein [Nocardioides sp.]
MTHGDPAAPRTCPTPPPMPSITASVLIEWRALVQSLGAWLMKG